MKEAISAEIASATKVDAVFALAVALGEALGDPSADEAKRADLKTFAMRLLDNFYRRFPGRLMRS